jgi:dTMP kinase
MKSEEKGKFITIEGIEGVGKSSNVQFIAKLIQEAGFQVVVTREPGGTQIAEEIRKILLTEYKEPTLPSVELLLLYAGRLQHVEHVIKPALAQGKWVVCDRFVDATYAYQGAGRGIAMEKIDILNQWTLGNFTPDCTIVLDAPVDVAFERIKNNRKLDRFEKEQKVFFEKIRKEYLIRAKQFPDRYHVVDAAKPLSFVQESLTKIMKELAVTFSV